MKNVTTSKVSKTSQVSGNTPVTGNPVALAAVIIAGIDARINSKFYRTALAYHRKCLTVFPRARNEATRLALTAAQVETVFKQHDKFVLSSGCKEAQAMFDVYMVDRQNY